MHMVFYVLFSFVCVCVCVTCILKRTLQNHETAKQRNSYFFPTFFLNTEPHKETNSADIGSVEKFVTCAKKGLQTWMSPCAID